MPHGSPASRLARLTARPPHGSPASRLARYGLLLLAALLTALTLMAPTAQAGTYVWSQTVNGVTTASPTYVGGAQAGNSAPPSGPYSLGGGGGSYGGGASSTVSSTGGPTSATASCQGTVTLTYTWQPAQGQTLQTDPPPPVAVAAVTCTAAWSGLVGGPHGPVPGAVSGGCSGPSGATLTSSVPATSPRSGVKNTYVLYVVQNNPGVSFPVSVSGLSGSASASAPSGSGEGGECDCSASVTPTLYPITIQLTGPVKDGSGNYDILIGQHCSAQLVGIPTGGGWSAAYQWSVTGPTCQSWAVSSDHSSTTYVDGPGPLNIASPGWYWHEIGNNASKPETVSCTVTLTPPAGQGNSFTLTVSQPVTVYIPSWSCTGTGSAMYVLNEGNNDYWLQAVGTPPETGGMDWRATIATPSFNPAGFGAGSVELVQLIFPGIGFYAEGQYYHWSDNGEEGLDAFYPYPWVNGAPNYFSRDSPGLSVSQPMPQIVADSAYVKDEFEDYLMFLAPGSSQYVPVAHFVWSTDGSATEPFQNNTYSWAWWPNGSTAGTVTPSGSATPFEQYNSFPGWTQNDAVSSNYWVGGQ